MLSEKKKTISFDIVDLIFIAFFTAHYLVPSFYFNFIIPMGLALAYCAYIGLKNHSVGKSILIMLAVALFLATVYTLLTDTKTISSTVDNVGIKQFFSKFNQYLMMYFPLLISYRVITTYPRKAKLLIILFICAVFIYVFARTFVLLLSNPGATRHWDDFSSLATEDVGSYDFVYAVPIIICTLAVCHKKFNFIGKIINIAVIVVSFVFLVNAGYTLALLITMVGIVLVVYSWCQKTTSKGIFLLVCIIGAFFIPNILELMYTNIPVGDIYYRLKEIHAFLTSGDSSGYNLNGRFSLYGETLLAFARSPIIGNRSLDFDGHGTFLTVLSDTGIMGTIPMYWLVFAARKRVKITLKEHNCNYMPIFVSFILMGIVNPIHATDALSFAMWCMAPLVIDYFFNKEELIGETSLES